MGERVPGVCFNAQRQQYPRASTVFANGMLTRSRWLGVSFSAAIVFVAATSFYDAFLVFQYRYGIAEQNPICDWLISLEPEFVSAFLAAKILNTLVVVSFLVGLFKYRKIAGVLVTAAIVVFQAGLMGYLHTSDDLPRLAREAAVFFEADRDAEIALHSTPTENSKTNRRNRAVARIGFADRSHVRGQKPESFRRWNHKKQKQLASQDRKFAPWIKTD